MPQRARRDRCPARLPRNLAAVRPAKRTEARDRPERRRAEPRQGRDEIGRLESGAENSINAPHPNRTLTAEEPPAHRTRRGKPASDPARPQAPAPTSTHTREPPTNHPRIARMPASARLFANRPRPRSGKGPQRPQAPARPRTARARAPTHPQAPDLSKAPAPTSTRAPANRPHARRPQAPKRPRPQAPAIPRPTRATEKGPPTPCVCDPSPADGAPRTRRRRNP